MNLVASTGGVLINYSRLLLSDLIMFIYVVTRE